MTLPEADEKAFFGTFNTLANMFGLNVTAADLLLLTIATELDERVYAAAVNVSGTMFGAPGPRIGSWLAVLYPKVSDRTEAFGALLNNGPLVRYNLLRILGPESTPLSQRELCGEPALLHHILPGEAPGLPENLIGLADLVHPPEKGAEVAGDGIIPPELWTMFDYLLRTEGTMRVLHLNPVLSRAAVPMARLLAARLKRPVIVLDLKTVEQDLDDPVAETLREARLRNGIAMFLNPMTQGDEEPNPRRMQRVAQRWRRALALEREVVIFATEGKDKSEVHMLEQVGLDVSTFELEKITFSERRKLFETSLAHATDPKLTKLPVEIGRDVSVDQLASVYRVGVGDVDAIVHHASVAARLRAGPKKKPVVGADDMWGAARERTRRDLGKFARRVESRYTWEDLVLPRDVMRRVFDLYTACINRARVFEDWGYAKKHLRGRGMCALFLGESGTGKTMSAEVMAHSLNVDLYQVEISAVVSKWIGETERNLSQLFDATEGSDSILFFDEADALFGKRTEVKESKDRYANMEVSYLLQRIEAYDGIVILASNLRSHIDTAFLRRFQYGISFPKPDEVARLAIWQRVFPDEVPIKDVDLEYLATRYEDLSGGQIKMVALGASLLAAGQNSPVTMKIIERAHDNEMHKLNRLVAEMDDDGAPLELRG
ncbi:MAG: ATP-binding protein [Deltaproteobacteria bacterium]|nr:ATP-binding protein [Deltaproteobacteria bacterium]